MDENSKLKALFELKKKIEQDLGRRSSETRKKENKNDRLSFSPQKSYNLDFSEISTVDDLYNLDFALSDETLAGIMESSKFSNDMSGVAAYLRGNFEEARNVFSVQDDPKSIYNAFMALMGSGELKEALEKALKLKNLHPLSPFSYLALAHVLFFLEDSRWEKSFKLYLAMSKDQIADFAWKIFNNSNDVKFLRTDRRKYLLDVGMFDSSDKVSTTEVLVKRICERDYNPCSCGFCDVVKAKKEVKLSSIRNNYCALEKYARALKMYVSGDFSGALKTVPKIKDPEFLYLEALCHFSMDEPNGFNSVVSEILRIEPQSVLSLSLSNERVKTFGMADENAALLKMRLSTLKNDYHSSLRRIIFEFAKLKDILPSKVNFSLKLRRYHIIRMFFGYRSCKGVYGDDKK